MKNKFKRFVVTIAILCLLIGITGNSFAHSGRTDSNGGHKDNQNKSGLGSYHYHCGGHPAHLHEGGVCPYSASTATYSEPSTPSSQSSTSTSTSETKKAEAVTTSTKVENKPVEETPTKEASIKATPVKEKIIKVESITINETLRNMKVGESSRLTATIMPENATDKNIIWESSDEDIATISSTGKIVALEVGKVKITAKTNDGKTDTVEITVEEVEEEIIAPVQNNEIDNINSSTSEDADAGSAILGLGIIGGCIWAYKKFNKSKKNS